MVCWRYPPIDVQLGGEARAGGCRSSRGRPRQNSRTPEQRGDGALLNSALLFFKFNLEAAARWFDDLLGASPRASSARRWWRALSSTTGFGETGHRRSRTQDRDGSVEVSSCEPQVVEQGGNAELLTRASVLKECNRVQAAGRLDLLPSFASAVV